MHRAGTQTGWEPRTRRLVLLAIVLAIPVLFSVRLAVMNDPDIWWHLRTGQWVGDHHAVPTTDPFSAFGAGKPWVAYSWLFELVAYGFYRAFGLSGVVILQAVLGFGVAAALYALIRRFTSNFVAAIALCATALFAMIPMYAPRPWLLTMLLFTIEVLLLLDARATEQTRRLWWLVPLLALWANIHVQFIYGLFALGLAAIEPMVERALAPLLHGSRDTAGDAIPTTSNRNALTMWALLAASTAATLLNPYGWRIYQVVFEYSSQPAVFNLVTEFHSLAFRQFPDFLVLLLTMGGVAALARRQRIQPFEILLLVAGAIISFRMARDVWFVVIVAVAFMAQAAGLDGIRERTFRRRDLLGACALVVVLALLMAGARHVNNLGLEQQLASRFPVRAVQEVIQRGYSGPLYNHFNWGGFLIWQLPGLPVGMDGRTNVHGDSRIARSVATWNGDAGWQADPELAASRLVITGAADQLFVNLRQDPRFRLVYQDQVAAVFLANDTR